MRKRDPNIPVVLPPRPAHPTADLQEEFRMGEHGIAVLIARGVGEPELRARLQAHRELIQKERNKRTLATGRDDGSMPSAWDDLTLEAPLHGAGQALTRYRQDVELKHRVAAGGDNR